MKVNKVKGQGAQKSTCYLEKKHSNFFSHQLQFQVSKMTA